MCDAVSIYCSQDSEDCPPLYIQRKFSQADEAAQALKSPGASALPKSYKLKLYGFILMDIPGGSDGKASACNAGDPGSIPGSGRPPGEGNGTPLQTYRRVARKSALLAVSGTSSGNLSVHNVIIRTK